MAEVGTETTAGSELPGAGLGDGAAASGPVSAGMDLLLDVPLCVTVELGRVKLPVRRLLALGAGAVIELAKAAGEPLDVLVNGRPVARGEAVMVNDCFGVRLTEIVSPTERIERDS